MFQVKELGSYLPKINLIRSMLQFSHLVRQEICKCIHGIVVVPSHLYKIMETLNWRFSWFLQYENLQSADSTFLRLLAESKSEVFVFKNWRGHTWLFYYLKHIFLSINFGLYFVHCFMNIIRAFLYRVKTIITL
jgi:hypothetical protein